MTCRRALLVALILLAFVPTAPAGAAPQGSGLLRLLSQTPAIEPAGDLMVRLQATSAPAGAQLRLTMYGRTVTRSGFQQTLGGRSLGRAIAPAVIVPAQADANGAQLISVHTAGSEAPVLPLSSAQEGVFPLTIELLDKGAKPLDQLLTYVIRLPAAKDDPPLNVSVIVPMGGAPLLQPDGTVTPDDGVRSTFVGRGAVLDSHASVPVTIDPIPESLSSLDRAGDKAPEQALRQSATGRQVRATSFVPVDTSAWLAAGLDGELGRQLERGSEVLTAAGVTPSKATWVADRPLTTAALRWLHDHGYRYVIVPEEGLSPLDGRRFPATLTQPFRVEGVDGVDVAVADAALAQHLRGDDPSIEANHLLADLAILYFDQPKAARVAVLDLPNEVAPGALNAVLGGLEAVRILRGSTLDDAMRTVPVAGSRGQADGSADPLVRKLSVNAAPASALAEQLRAAERDLGSFVDAVTTSDLVTNLDERVLVSGADSIDDRRRREYLDTAVSTVRAELRKVEAPHRQVISFTARDGVVSFIVRNKAGYPIRVVVHLEGTKLQLPDNPDGSLAVTLAEETTRVSVNVHTLASGDSPLDVTITTPDGRIEMGRTRIIVRSTAFSGVGIVLSIGAGLFLLLWWARHTVQTRREARSASRSRHPNAAD